MTYLAFEALTLLLGSGADTLLVDSTHAGTTRVDTGAGADKVDIETIAGLTRIEGGAGADTIRVNPILDATNGLAAKLTLDGEGGADAYLINTWGNGDSVIDVADSGADGALNTLSINGTQVADQFLLRRDLVALLNTLRGRRLAARRADRVRHRDQDAGDLQPRRRRPASRSTTTAR